MKNQFEFWNFRDVRKIKFPVLKTIEVVETSSKISNSIEILISHGYLIPLENTPIEILQFFKSDLTISNPEFEDCVKYGKGFVPKHIQQYLYLYLIDSKYIALPRSIKKEILEEQFRKKGIQVFYKDIRPNFEKLIYILKPSTEPWYYQYDAIDKIVNSQNSILKFNCGKGKTILTLIAVYKIQLRTLILLRNNLLLQQWKSEILEMFIIDEKDIGIFNGDSKTHGKITLATVQSLANLSRDEKRKISEMYGYIIADECHEGGGNQYLKLLQMFKCKKISGLTATPIRSDGKSKIIVCYIGKIIKIDDGGIIPVKFDFVKTKFSFKHDNRKNEYTAMMQKLIDDEDRNNLIVDKILEYSNVGLIFVYSCRIAHLATLQQKVKERNSQLKTAIISYKTPDGKKMKTREQELIRNQVQKEEIDVVFGTQIIKQGFNAKPLKICIISVPQKSSILIPQIIGRTQREYKDKEEVIVVDFIDELIQQLLYQYFYKHKNFYKPIKEQSAEKKLELKKYGRKKVESKKMQLSIFENQ